MPESGRLAGCTVLVTRPAHQADHFCHLIEAEGGKALRFPVIKINEAEDQAGLQSQVAKAGHCDYLVFISPNAVAMGLPLVEPLLHENTKIAVIGNKTAEAMIRHGYQPQIVPRQGANSEALLEQPELQSLSGQHVVIVRGGRGRDLLASTIRERGAEVTLLDVYQRSIPRHNAALQPLLMQTDIVAITSNEGLSNLFAMADNLARDTLLKLPLLAGSQRVLVLASEIGFKAAHINASSPADDAMFEALSLWVQSGEHISV